MKQSVQEKLMLTGSFTEFQKIAKEYGVTEFRDIGEDALRHMAELMREEASLFTERPIAHTDPLKKK